MNLIVTYTPSPQIAVENRWKDLANSYDLRTTEGFPSPDTCKLHHKTPLLLGQNIPSYCPTPNISESAIQPNHAIFGQHWICQPALEDHRAGSCGRGTFPRHWR